MKTVIMTDLRTRAAQEAAEYLKMQGYAVQIVPEDIPLWDEAALSAWAEPFRDALIGVIHPAHFDNPAMILRIVLTHLGLPTELPVSLSFSDQASFAAETIRRVNANGKFDGISYGGGE